MHATYTYSPHNNTKLGSIVLYNIPDNYYRILGNTGPEQPNCSEPFVVPIAAFVYIFKDMEISVAQTGISKLIVPN